MRCHGNLLPHSWMITSLRIIGTIAHPNAYPTNVCRGGMSYARHIKISKQSIPSFVRLSPFRLFCLCFLDGFCFSFSESMLVWICVEVLTVLVGVCRFPDQPGSLSFSRPLSSPIPLSHMDGWHTHYTHTLLIYQSIWHQYVVVFLIGIYMFVGLSDVCSARVSWIDRSSL
jgi:hypothetical protein